MLNAASGLGLGFASYAIYSIINRLSLVSSAPRSATERNYEGLAKVGPEASMCMDVRDTPAREDTIPIKKMYGKLP